MRRLLVILGMLTLVVPTVFAHPAWDWPWPEPAATPRLGVLVSDLSSRELDTLELPYGVQVKRVLPDSPAEAGGLHAGDILLELDSRPVFSVARLRWLIDKSAPDKALALGYYRAGESSTAQITLAAPRTRPLPTPGMHKEWVWTSPRYFGVSLQSMTEGLRDAFAVPGDAGMLVSEVFPASPADRAGLRPGDVIVRMNQRAIRDMDDVQRVLDYLEPGEQMDVEIIREKQAEQLVVTLGTREAPGTRRPWRDWRGTYGEDAPFFVDPDWWRGIEEFMQRWRQYWDDDERPPPRRAL